MTWILKILGGIKANLFFVLGSVVSVLLIAVKVLTGQNSRLRRKVETADARIHHAKVTAKKKEENAEVFRGRTREIAKEIEEKKSTDSLSDPNKDWK